MMSAVLLLRSTQESGKADKYKEVFTAAGLPVRSISPIGFEFFDLDELYRCVSRPEGFSGIIFSSPRTVASVRRCVEENSSMEEWETSGLRAKWSALPAFSVGTSTASEAQQLGFQTVGDDSGNAENLVQLISQKIQSGQPPLLFPCGTLRRDVIPNHLQDNNIAFTSCTVYRTCPEPSLEQNLTSYLEEHGVPRAVTFFSPSGVRFSKVILEKLQIVPSSHCKFFAIGSTTERAMLDNGLTISGVSSKPSPESLLDCIRGGLERSGVS